ncbi:MAG: undecaprenyl-diphosphate phosphatase [Gammaproteobacteria bacterium]
MDTVQAVILAFLQGFTEFLPISSSGHLILVPQFLGWADQGLAFDVAVHLGTLAAVLAYFRRDLVVMGRDWFASLAGGESTPDSRLAWRVILGTVPVVVAGGLLAGPVEESLRSPLVVGAATAGFGVLLWLADRRGARVRDEHSLSWTDALIVGLAQVLALIPGTSRSGITMTAGLMLGLRREAAARFSFLLAIPVILAAATLELAVLMRTPGPQDWNALAVGTAVSAVVAYVTIRGFLALLNRMGMAPFAVYRVLLGALIFWVYL